MLVQFAPLLQRVQVLEEQRRSSQKAQEASGTEQVLAQGTSLQEGVLQNLANETMILMTTAA